MFRKLNSKKGYALVWVLAILLVITFFSMALVSSTIISSRSTKWQHDSQQAYFTAKSAANAVADYIVQYGSDSAKMNSIVNITPIEKTVSGLGTYSVAVTRDSQKFTITANAAYNNERATVKAYIVKSLPGIIPTDKSIYVDGNAIEGFGQCNVYDIGATGDSRGGVFVNGSMNFSRGSQISGELGVTGTTTFSGGTNTTKDIISFGTLRIDAGATIDGNVSTKGDLIFSGAGTVNGNAYADGSLNMPNGLIQQNAIIKTNASFAGGARINGTLTYGGTVSVAWGTISSFVPLGATKNTGITALDFSQYMPQALPIIYTPTIAENAQLYNPVVVNTITKTISDSGTITSSVVTQFNSFSYGSVITIDATTKDIFLLLNNTNLDFSGRSIEVDGDHNVFIYLKGTSEIEIGANGYLGMNPRGSNPKLYIIGEGTQSIELTSSSGLNAVVYLPKGSVSASGSDYIVLNSLSYKFVGCCIVKEISITNDVSFKYSPPDVIGTPLDIFGSGGAVSASGWTLEGWG